MLAVCNAWPRVRSSRDGYRVCYRVCYRTWHSVEGLPIVDLTECRWCYGGRLPSTAVPSSRNTLASSFDAQTGHFFGLCDLPLTTRQLGTACHPLTVSQTISPIIVYSPIPFHDDLLTTVPAISLSDRTHALPSDPSLSIHWYRPLGCQHLTDMTAASTRTVLSLSTDTNGIE